MGWSQTCSSATAGMSHSCVCVLKGVKMIKEAMFPLLNQGYALILQFLLQQEFNFDNTCLPI